MSHSRLIKLFPFLSCPKYENFTQTKRPDTQGCCAGDSMFLLAFMFTHFPQNVSERIAFTTFLLPFAAFFGAAESTGWLYDCFSFFYSSLKSSGCVNNFRVFKFFGWFSILFSSTWWQQQILSRVFHRVQLWRQSGRDEVCQKAIDNNFPSRHFPSSAGERFHFSSISSAWKCCLVGGKAAHVKIECQVTFTSMPVCFWERNSLNWLDCRSTSTLINFKTFPPLSIDFV